MWACLRPLTPHGSVVNVPIPESYDLISVLLLHWSIRTAGSHKFEVVADGVSLVVNHDECIKT